MKLIIGLGNPGQQYEGNRHNVGFMILEKIAEKKGLTFNLQSEFESKIAELDIDGKAKLIQPQTFMNDSGRAVVKIKNYFKINLENIWVVSDEVDLALGQIRIGLGGSSAGHKGVQSIIDNIGEQFYRIRIGVGRNEKISTEKWVLQNFNKDEMEIVSQVVDKVADKMLESLSNNLKEEKEIIWVPKDQS
ncbi:MAG: Peptidyl-tRNA hydrolase [Berkelbacteria bacterium GW2011_GWA1_36_9]|uniref:Peptidyl-tRNA hydrolase n=1 Tax=Berkelbacteria bacterium GW2011_GWA1_36_9 TaxID=1618331 RepID=A0A0G0I1J2_9BACT|nr:MAG: Peptidyl-tRNA hydrolase [Berkelbacteria bacterium GW2011_GWA1_36_9]